jgi:hypothetical protein
MAGEDENKVGQDGNATPGKDSTVTDPSKQVFGDGEDGKLGDAGEPTDQRERSNLGRRVKRMEDTVNTLLSKLDNFVDNVGRGAIQTQNYQNYDDEEDEEFIRKMQKYEKKKVDRQKDYEKNYISKVRQLGSGEPDYKEIFDEMYSNFNVIHSGDPEIDARLNWADARASVLSKKISPNRPNVKGERNTASTDLGVNAINDSATSSEVQLDDFAKEFVAHTGMKKEKVESALKSDLRPGVSGRR